MKKKPMYRFLIALAFALVLFTPGLAQAQAGATPTPVAPNQRPTIPSIRLPLSRPAQETVAVTTTVTESAVISATALVTDVLAPAAAATPDPYANILEGTIIANRTELPVRFFVEGQTYDLAPLRSLGLALPRESAVLNLFNCAASRDSTDPACFWDPYLLTLDGFYEVIDGAVAGRTVDVALREAGEPDSNQIWVQNRLGAVESIVVGDEVVELAPSSVREFVVGSDGPVIVQLRECIELGGQSVCEWTPRGVDAGFYYGLVRKESPGPNGAQLVRVELERVLAPATASDAGAPITEGACRLLVPTLNVRSGPGLEFSILTKVRSTTEAPASITVIGFDPTRQWMQVEPTVAAGGWVIANPDYIVCSGDLAQLPIILPPVVEAPPTPTPEPAPTPEPVIAAAPVAAPAVVVEAPAVAEAPADAAPIETATEAAAEPTGEPIPPGQARLVINNGFDQVIRFTMEQRFRVDTANPAGEWDLEPNQSLTLQVYPGMVSFSASTPWRGLGDNADFFINEGEERPLWLYFVPDPSGNGEWILQF
jgi:hypothetical protein